MTDPGRVMGRVARDGVAYGLGILASRLAAFILLPIVTRRLPADEVGQWGLLTSLASLVAAALAMGLGTAILRETSGAPDEVDPVESAAARALLPVSLGLLVLAVVSALAAPGGVLVALALAAAAGEVLLVAPLARIRAAGRAGLFVLLGLGRFVVTLGVSVVLVMGMGWGVEGVLAGSAAGALTVGGIFVPRLVRVFRGGSMDRLRALLVFGVPVMLANLGSLLVDVGDRWLVAALTDLETVGLYDVGYRMAKYAHVALIQPFSLAWPPVLFALARTAHGEAAVGRMLTFTVAIMGVVALVVGTARTWVFGWVAPPAYDPAYDVVPWVLAGYVCLAAYYVLIAGAQLARRTTALPLAVGAAVVVNGLSVGLLVPRMGLVGAAVGTTLAYAVMAVIGGALSHRARAIPYEWGRVSALALVLLAVVAAMVAGFDRWGAVSVAIVLVVLIAAPWRGNASPPSPDPAYTR